MPEALEAHLARGGGDGAGEEGAGGRDAPAAARRALGAQLERAAAGGAGERQPPAPGRGLAQAEPPVGQGEAEAELAGGGAARVAAAAGERGPALAGGGGPAPGGGFASPLAPRREPPPPGSQPPAGLGALLPPSPAAANRARQRGARTPGPLSPGPPQSRRRLESGQPAGFGAQQMLELFTAMNSQPQFLAMVAGLAAQSAARYEGPAAGLAWPAGAPWGHQSSGEGGGAMDPAGTRRQVAGSLWQPHQQQQLPPGATHYIGDVPVAMSGDRPRMRLQLLRKLPPDMRLDPQSLADYTSPGQTSPANAAVTPAAHCVALPAEAYPAAKSCLPGPSSNSSNSSSSSSSLPVGGPRARLACEADSTAAAGTAAAACVVADTPASVGATASGYPASPLHRANYESSVSDSCSSASGANWGAGAAAGGGSCWVSNGRRACNGSAAAAESASLSAAAALASLLPTACSALTHLHISLPTGELLSGSGGGAICRGCGPSGASGGGVGSGGAAAVSAEDNEDDGDSAACAPAVAGGGARQHREQQQASSSHVSAPAAGSERGLLLPPGVQLCRAIARLPHLRVLHLSSYAMLTGVDAAAAADGGAATADGGGAAATGLAAAAAAVAAAASELAVLQLAALAAGCPHLEELSLGDAASELLLPAAADALPATAAAALARMPSLRRLRLHQLHVRAASLPGILAALCGSSSSSSSGSGRAAATPVAAAAAATAGTAAAERCYSHLELLEFVSPPSHVPVVGRSWCCLRRGAERAAAAAAAVAAAAAEEAAGAPADVIARGGRGGSWGPATSAAAAAAAAAAGPVDAAGADDGDSRWDMQWSCAFGALASFAALAAAAVPGGLRLRCLHVPTLIISPRPLSVTGCAIVRRLLMCGSGGSSSISSSSSSVAVDTIMLCRHSRFCRQPGATAPLLAAMRQAVALLGPPRLLLLKHTSRTEAELLGLVQDLAGGGGGGGGAMPAAGGGGGGGISWLQELVLWGEGGASPAALATLMRGLPELRRLCVWADDSAGEAPARAAAAAADCAMPPGKYDADAAAAMELAARLVAAAPVRDGGSSASCGGDGGAARCGCSCGCGCGCSCGRQLVQVRMRGACADEALREELNAMLHRAGVAVRFERQ
ncbi:hypothetical protein HXX76_007496 [Chlamydomonas incerta]|uniref:Uncharacterized protein n=1 Tax=Chlamydomonas incerta TaxID=51695 RepID=A0A835TAH9_CHLIN|nr:hypothetical protein HXX76_007496 [Chlamydomonas incerta]|eukprot:KAG2434601.1 hypothetical protein HXX76_007496 [Chlamydomonas incerta]